MRIEFSEYCLSYHATLYNIGYAYKIQATGELTTPYRCILGYELRIDHIHIFGISVVVFVNQEARGNNNKDKVQLRVRNGFFLGPNMYWNAWLIEEKKIKNSTTYEIIDNFEIDESISDPGYCILSDSIWFISISEDFHENNSEQNMFSSGVACQSSDTRFSNHTVFSTWSD